ncbi:hypothetical protein BRADI_5g11225v3 [Brachypodium distachyon]|uniref:Uncharacterized protein n=1 Tax=Brachypodium distachyon TaxID=15368 RepID=A0A0Q3P2B6_BRADI|nr:hypothetical protein BRADI_5g11225v3 [Brachypodium distachyon]
MAKLPSAARPRAPRARRSPRPPLPRPVLGRAARGDLAACCLCARAASPWSPLSARALLPRAPHPVARAFELLTGRLHHAGVAPSSASSPEPPVALASTAPLRLHLAARAPPLHRAPPPPSRRVHLTFPKHGAATPFLQPAGPACPSPSPWPFFPFSFLFSKINKILTCGPCWSAPSCARCRCCVAAAPRRAALLLHFVDAREDHIALEMKPRDYIAYVNNYFVYEDYIIYDAYFLYHRLRRGTLRR